jgi:hypothetical protein
VGDPDRSTILYERYRSLTHFRQNLPTLVPTSGWNPLGWSCGIINLELLPSGSAYSGEALARIPTGWPLTSHAGPMACRTWSRRLRLTPGRYHRTSNRSVAPIDGLRESATSEPNGANHNKHDKTDAVDNLRGRCYRWPESFAID